LFLQLGELFGRAFRGQPGISLDLLERLENTSFGSSFQIRANSSSCSALLKKRSLLQAQVLWLDQLAACPQIFADRRKLQP